MSAPSMRLMTNTATLLQAIAQDREQRGAQHFSKAWLMVQREGLDPAKLFFLAWLRLTGRVSDG